MNVPPPPSPPPPPPPPPPPAATEVATATTTLPPDFADSVTDVCRKMELARGQAAELEALRVFGASLLSNLTTDNSSSGSSNANGSQEQESSNPIMESLPDSLQDVYAELERVSAEAASDQTEVIGAAGNSTTGKQAKKKRHFPPPGQFGKALETHVIASCVRGAAQQASDVYTARVTEGPALRQAIADLRRTVATHASSSSAGTTSLPSPSHPLLTVLDQGVQTLRLYHARRQQQQQSTTTDTAARRITADGFDLAARARQEWLQPLTSASLYTDAEVCGKYLDFAQPAASTWAATLQTVVQHKPDKDTKDLNNGSSKRRAWDSLDLVQWLCRDQGLGGIPTAAKLAHRKAYERTLVQLEHYLRDYLHRTIPLLDVDKVIVAPIVSGDTKNNGANSAAATSAGDDDGNPPPQPPTPPALDVEKYDSAQALCDAVDADALKAACGRLGLKCGGTPLDRARRLFATKGIPDPANWPAKIKAKKGSALMPTSALPMASTRTNQAEAVSASSVAGNLASLPLATREAVVTALLDQVRPALEATLKRLERQQGQTLAEREKEIEEDLYGSKVGPSTKKRKTNADGGEEGDDDDDDDDDDAPIYNPKNVPLDWDGKPIPYWLYKLHGLQHYYMCEICGGESYRGRRNFELHFADQKHAAGMKSLGIPNTKHFHGVTKIQDANDLWEALKEKMKSDQFDTSKDEEYEDSKGNVLSRTAYEDLARQGLL